MGIMGRLRSNAWICDFSSTLRSMARSSGGHVEADDVANLGDESIWGLSNFRFRTLDDDLHNLEGFGVAASILAAPKLC